MRKTNKILLSSLLITSSLFASNGEEIFNTSCKSCHIMKKGWQITDQEKMTMQGPSAFGITKHVREVFSNEKQFVEFVSEYITKPTMIKARCKDHALKKFGLMPAVGLKMTKEDKEAVAKWMFNKL